MTKDEIEAIVTYVEAHVDYELAIGEVEADGYRATARDERNKRDEALAALRALDHNRTRRMATAT